MTDDEKDLCEREEDWLEDCYTYADRCAETTGEAHLLFEDESGAYYARHIGQVRNPRWNLIYMSNPYPLN